MQKFHDDAKIQDYHKSTYLLKGRENAVWKAFVLSDVLGEEEIN
jgi:hypothetical protein